MSVQEKRASAQFLRGIAEWLEQLADEEEEA
jgi:hypothetical protein